MIALMMVLSLDFSRWVRTATGLPLTRVSVRAHDLLGVDRPALDERARPPGRARALVAPANRLECCSCSAWPGMASWTIRLCTMCRLYSR